MLWLGFRHFCAVTRVTRNAGKFGNVLERSPTPPEKKRSVVVLLLLQEHIVGDSVAQCAALRSSAGHLVYKSNARPCSRPASCVCQPMCCHTAEFKPQQSAPAHVNTFLVAASYKQHVHGQKLLEVAVRVQGLVCSVGGNTAIPCGLAVATS